MFFCNFLSHKKAYQHSSIIIITNTFASAAKDYFFMCGLYCLCICFCFYNMFLQASHIDLQPARICGFFSLLYLHTLKNNCITTDLINIVSHTGCLKALF